MAGGSSRATARARARQQPGMANARRMVARLPPPPPPAPPLLKLPAAMGDGGGTGCPLPGGGGGTAGDGSPRSPAPTGRWAGMGGERGGLEDGNSLHGEGLGSDLRAREAEIQTHLFLPLHGHYLIQVC